MSAIPRWVSIGIPVGLGILAVALLLVLVLLPPLGNKGSGLASVQVVSAAPDKGVQVAILPEHGGGAAVQGKTPWRVSLAPGRYRYVATAPGYRTAHGSISVPQGEPTVTVEIPAMEPAAGKVLVRSNALVQVFVDGTNVGAAGPDPAQWASFGPFAAGQHVVSATAALSTQEQTITVSEQYERKVEFFWGSRLYVVVEPAGIPSTTITVDGRPYTGPLDFEPSRLSSRPFAQVTVSAPGYTAWAEDVFLQPGDAVTASAVLQAAAAATETATVTPTADVEAAVLEDYWRFWQVWNEAGQTLDVDRLPEAMTGEFLDVQTLVFSVANALGTMESWSIAPAPHTPTVTRLTASAADVQVLCDVTHTQTLKGGAVATEVDHLDGTFAMQIGADGVWRVASLSGTWAHKAEPTPVGGGHGRTRPAPPDREAIVQILLANINCLRADSGLPAVTYDSALAAAVQPIADAATAYAQERMWSLPDNVDEIEAAVRDLGGFYLAEMGLPLSLVPGNAREGSFAYDWANYAGDPCSARWERSNPEPWQRPMTRIAIVLGPAVWDSVYYKTVLIAVGR
ncbi:MAG: hypothetical protein ACUVRC_10825, partial [Desulfotomaculales bacterium]